MRDAFIVLYLIGIIIVLYQCLMTYISITQHSVIRQHPVFVSSKMWRIVLIAIFLAIFWPLMIIVDILDKLDLIN